VHADAKHAHHQKLVPAGRLRDNTATQALTRRGACAWVRRALTCGCWLQSPPAEGRTLLCDRCGCGRTVRFCCWPAFSFVLPRIISRCRSAMSAFWPVTCARPRSSLGCRPPPYMHVVRSWRTASHLLLRHAHTACTPARSYCGQNSRAPESAVRTLKHLRELKPKFLDTRGSPLQGGGSISARRCRQPTLAQRGSHLRVLHGLRGRAGHGDGRQAVHVRVLQRALDQPPARGAGHQPCQRATAPLRPAQPLSAP